MTDRPASWRMPAPKQMEKLAAEAARRPRRSASVPESATPGRILGIDSQRPSRRRDGGPDEMRQRGLSEIQRHVLRVSCRRCERTVEIQTADAVRLYGGNAVWKTSRSGCLITPASSAPAGIKKTGAGQRSRRHSPLRSDLLQLSIT